MGSVWVAVAIAAYRGYTDSSEYNLVRAIEVQPDANRKLALLERWKQLYPRSPQRQQRFELLVRTQQSLGMWANREPGAMAVWIPESR